MMNQKQIVDLAEKIGMGWAGPAIGFKNIPVDQLVKFARHVAKVERDRCVRVIEKESQDWDSNYKEVALELAGAIEEEK